jgi:hypothetical protein
MAGDIQTAIALYVAAAAKTASVPEKDYLLKQAARLGEAGVADSRSPRGRPHRGDSASQKEK